MCLCACVFVLRHAWQYLYIIDFRQRRNTSQPNIEPPLKVPDRLPRAGALSWEVSKIDRAFLSHQNVDNPSWNLLVREQLIDGEGNFHVKHGGEKDLPLDRRLELSHDLAQADVAGHVERIMSTRYFFLLPFKYISLISAAVGSS